MSRWNDTVTLLSARAPSQDAEGAWHDGGRTERMVFCNRYTRGLAPTARPVDVGLRVTAQIQVRAADYAGEDEVMYHGQELEVLDVTGGGEFFVLSVGRRIANV